MNAEKMKKPNVLAVMIVASVLLATGALTMTTITTQDAFAYSRNQASVGTNDCGNGELPLNIGCQNTASQIQGDENSVALTSLQTFPSVEREPETCEECFTFVLSDREQAQLIDLIAQNFNEGITSIEDLCDPSDGDAIFSPSDIAITEQLLGQGTTDPPVQGMNLDEDRIAEIIECLHRILGF